MALVHLHYHSHTLGKKVAAEVLLPEVGKPPFAVFYLLHGLSDDHTIWLRHTRLEVYAAKLPLIIVMPDGFRGFYTDHHNGPAYGRYIGIELVDLIDRQFQTRARREARAIGGLSMGGYGALRLALRYPDRFASANSHSGAVMHGHDGHKTERVKNILPERKLIFGPRPAGTEHDLIHLAGAVSARRRPKLMIDCGTEDFLLDDNRRFHARLEAMGYPHVYHEHPGAHTWDYWDLHIREALAFHAQNLRLPVVT